MGKTHRHATGESAVHRDLRTPKYHMRVVPAGRGAGSYNRNDVDDEINEYLAEQDYVNSYDDLDDC